VCDLTAGELRESSCNSKACVVGGTRLLGEEKEKWLSRLSWPKLAVSRLSRPLAAPTEPAKMAA
jgi:hypothetical protein